MADDDLLSCETENPKWFWDTVFSLWSSYSEMFIASFLINVFALAIPLFVMSVYNKVIPNKSFDTLWVLASGVFIVFFFDLLMRNLRGYFIDQTEKVIDSQVSANLFKKIMSIKISERRGSLGAFSNIIQSFNHVRDFIKSTTITVLIDFPFVIVFLFVIAVLGGRLVILPILMLAITMIFGIYLQEPLREHAKLSRRYAEEKEGLLFEILNGIETIKADCAEDIMQSRWERLNQEDERSRVKSRFITNLGITFSVLAQQLVVVFIVIVGVYKISEGQLSMGALIACAILASQTLTPMVQMAGIMTRYHQAVVAIKEINRVMLLPIEHSASEPYLAVSTLKGEIEFRDVTFQYEDRHTPALQKFSLKINAGERVGIIGRVGSGKTTIAKLILGLLEPSSGSIFIDGMNQRKFNLTQLRYGIGYVPEDAMLFSGSLHDNIILGAPNVDDEQVLRAIEIAGIDQLLKPSLGSYEAMITEGGKNISAGQRRIVAIARAVLLNPTVLVFDEPTHSMDNQTEAILKARLTFYTQSKTLILMSHHMSMLSLVDRVIMLDSGRVIVDGQRDDVLQALKEGQIKVPKV